MSLPFVRWMRWVALLLGGLSFSAQAVVTCSASMTNLNFGNFDPLLGGSNATATVNWQCTNDNVFLEANVTLCLSIGSGEDSTATQPRTMNDGTGDPLEFQLYRDAGQSQIWGSVTTSATPDPVQHSMRLGLGSLGSKTVSGSDTLYGVLAAGQNGVTPGTYSSQFTGGHAMLSFQFVENSAGQGTPPASCGTQNNGSFPFMVQAQVAQACQVSASPLVFPSAGRLTSAISSSNQLTLKCSTGLNYQIALNNGQNASGATRRMKNGTQHINYELYRNSGHTLRWGNTAGTDTVSGTGTGSNQSVTVYAQVPSQTTPSAGTYSDQVTVTVSY